MFAIYIIGALIIGAFSLYAQAKVKSNFARYGKVPASCGLTGAEAAQEMLSREGIYNVRVEQTGGFLSDHYDPRANVIRLSPEVYGGRSLSALGVACHEAGHAIQAARRYAPLVIRNAAVPVAGFGSQAGLIILIGGLILQLQPLAIIGLLLFGAVVFFQLVNLLPEYDASARAKQALVSHGLINRGEEEEGVSRVLDAAAMTYLAATISAVFTFLYYAMLVFNRR